MLLRMTRWPTPQFEFSMLPKFCTSMRNWPALRLPLMFLNTSWVTPKSSLCRSGSITAPRCAYSPRCALKYLSWATYDSNAAACWSAVKVAVPAVNVTKFISDVLRGM